MPKIELWFSSPFELYSYIKYSIAGVFSIEIVKVYWIVTLFVWSLWATYSITIERKLFDGISISYRTSLGMFVTE